MTRNDFCPRNEALGVRHVAAVVILAAAAALARADSAWLYGIHWWGHTPGQPVDPNPATLLDCPAYGGWDVETVLTHDASWWAPGHFSGLYQVLGSNNVTIITRIDYRWGETVPAPGNPDDAGWPASCVSAVNALRHGCHIWVIGNEPNIVGEGSGWPNGQVTPTGYAAIYRSVRNAIHGTALPSPHGEHIVLVAPPSPGGVIPGIRWMDGNAWLGQVLAGIPQEEVDGVALHAYGGSINDFHYTYVSQLNLIDSKGLQDRPVYITEWNKVSAEADMAQFVRDAFTDLNAWNQVAGRHNIRCLCWFVYDADQQAGGQWDAFSIEYWRSHGIPLGDPNDVFTAFEQTVDLRYPAGVVGVRGVHADFIAQPTTGRVPLTVSFTDQSTGAMTAWSWTFGDSTGSHSRNPVHTYALPGRYTVSLAVAGPDGSDRITRADYIAVLPIAGDFDADMDVDQADFGHLQECFTGPAVSPSDPDCLDARLDEDGDVDADDLTVFLSCVSGADVPADPQCAGN